MPVESTVALQPPVPAWWTPPAERTDTAPLCKSCAFACAGAEPQSSQFSAHHPRPWVAPPRLWWRSERCGWGWSTFVDGVARRSPLKTEKASWRREAACPERRAVRPGSEAGEGEQVPQASAVHSCPQRKTPAYPFVFWWRSDVGIWDIQ